jgi:hypothetical protein
VWCRFEGELFFELFDLFDLFLDCVPCLLLLFYTPLGEELDLVLFGGVCVVEEGLDVEEVLDDELHDTEEVEEGGRVEVREVNL